MVLGERDEYMLFGLWAATLGLLGGGALLSLLATLFGAINAATTPADTVAGVAGLMIWNALAGEWVDPLVGLILMPLGVDYNRVKDLLATATFFTLAASSIFAPAKNKRAQKSVYVSASA